MDLSCFTLIISALLGMGHIFYRGYHWLHTHTFSIRVVAKQNATHFIICPILNNSNFLQKKQTKNSTISRCHQACKAVGSFELCSPFISNVYSRPGEMLYSLEHAADLCPVLHRCLCCRRWSANRAKLPFDE